MIEVLNGTLETVKYNEQSGIRLHFNDETENYPVHWHTAIEIIMPLENIYTVEVGNKVQILRPKEILVIPSGELHKLFAPEYGTRLIMLVDSSLLHEFPEFNFILQTMQPSAHISFDFDSDVREKLCSIMSRISTDYFSKAPFRKAVCHSLLIDFFVTLGNSFWSLGQENDAANKKKSIYIERVLAVCHYINEHCTENITVDKMAEVAGFSKFHFCRLFKEQMNVSCYRYLITRRIMYAEKLLSDENCSVTQAAIQAGFNSLSTFNRVFREQKHCTPTEFISLNKST